MCNTQYSKTRRCLFGTTAGIAQIPVIDHVIMDDLGFAVGFAAVCGVLQHRLATGADMGAAQTGAAGHNAAPSCNAKSPFNQ